MKRTTYQVPELRDENDNIIQQGAFGKNTALANSTNDGWIDYVANDLEALRDNINGSRIYVKNKDALTTPGDISAMYIAEDTGKWYLWDGNKYIETDNARKIADEAIAARDAAKASQTAAKTSEQNAKTSETNAAASAKAAATSASGAASSASAASGSATAAANSAKAAATSEANAKTSETHAASSETNAASYLAQAQTIKEAVDGALGKVTSAMKYAGSVNTYADLPTANRNLGNVYNVKTADSTHGIKAGENVAWNGTDWDPLGGTVDLSPYATNTSVAGAFMNVTYSNATLNFVKKDGSTVSVTVNNVAHATSADSATSATSATSAAKATADANGNNIGNTYVKKTDVANAVTTATLTVTGAATAPTAVEGTEDNSVATTKFVANTAANAVELALSEVGKNYATKTEARVLPGTVTAFSGTFNNGFPVDKNTGMVNKEWHLCDGTNGTPDLRNRFIYGGDGTNNGATGGEVKHQLTVDEMPSHVHSLAFGTTNISFSFSIRSQSKDAANVLAGTNTTVTRREHNKGYAVEPSSSGSWYRDELSFNQNITPTGTMGSTGGNQPHNNMPPYYVLAFIMKL